MDVSDLSGMFFAPRVNLDYTNHRGVLSRRQVIPVMLWRGTSDFHEGEQDFLMAYDLDKEDVRDFAVKDIHSWETVQSMHTTHLMESARSPRWPKVRHEHLSIEPRCRACDTDKCLQVHHIKPFHLFPDLELVQANLITLCETPSKNCHFRDGHCFNWQKYNPNVIEDATRMLDRIANARDA